MMIQKFWMPPESRSCLAPKAPYRNLHPPSALKITAFVELALMEPRAYPEVSC
jgi:hypothetical protein